MKAGTMHAPQDIPLTPGAHGQQQTGPHMLLCGEGPSLLIDARQPQPPPEFYGGQNAALFMAVMMRQLLRRRAQLAEIVT